MATYTHTTQSQPTDQTIKQKYSVIVAVDKDKGIAKDYKIPWHYPEDLKWFNEKTKGHKCVMGRHTYEEIDFLLKQKNKQVDAVANNHTTIQTTVPPSVLPGRDCYVVSKTLKVLENATVVSHFREVEYANKENENTPIFILGGEMLLRVGLSLATDVFLTIIDKSYGCDKFFPVEFVLNRFKIVEAHRGKTPELFFLHLTR